jgi:hypothetical protein
MEAITGWLVYQAIIRSIGDYYAAIIRSIRDYYAAFADTDNNVKNNGQFQETEVYPFI